MTSGWLAGALGLSVRVDHDAHGAGLDGLAGLALRRNPRRAHLLVSRVLGKHLPVDPAVALAAGAVLAGRVSPAPGPAARVPPLVVGYCETATSLGHAVADALPGAAYLHSTRRVVPGWRPLLEFDEAHSHASHHWLMPADPDLLRTPRPVVLVDDELTTGRTALATIRALHRLARHPSYTVAALLDLRPAAERAGFDRLAEELGVPVRAGALLSGELLVPADVAERARAVLARHGRPAAPPPGPCHPVRRVAVDWPAELPDGARHGWGAAE
ncbi:MAG TPA: phosphoribosyltransferase domain-containing protein, partial [Frankiaceae bacterium]|nr:phosphoribosyltransferase domain-containing protein [Frankiaceae bacterium]